MVRFIRKAGRIIPVKGGKANKLKEKLSNKISHTIATGNPNTIKDKRKLKSLSRAKMKVENLQKSKSLKGVWNRNKPKTLVEWGAAVTGVGLGSAYLLPKNKKGSSV